MTVLSDDELKALYIAKNGVTKCPTVWNFGATQYQELVDDSPLPIDYMGVHQLVYDRKQYKRRKK
jgi:hypothetical protein